MSSIFVLTSHFNPVQSIHNYLQNSGPNIRPKFKFTLCYLFNLNSTVQPSVQSMLLYRPTWNIEFLNTAYSI